MNSRAYAFLHIYEDSPLDVHDSGTDKVALSWDEVCCVILERSKAEELLEKLAAYLGKSIHDSPCDNCLCRSAGVDEGREQVFEDCVPVRNEGYE